MFAGGSKSEAGDDARVSVVPTMVRELQAR
jgi:hypothetical protein